MEWATPKKPVRMDGLTTYSVKAKSSIGVDEFVVIAKDLNIANKLASEEHIRRYGVSYDSVEITIQE